MLEFSSLIDFSDPDQVEGFFSSRKDPNADPVKDQTLSWDQWTVVKKRLGPQGYFRIRAWDAINRETVSEIRPIQIYYFLVGDWDVYGKETVSVVLDGQSGTDTVYVSDQFTFYLDGRRFAMTELTGGKWKERPNYKYAITFPYDYLASYFEKELKRELGVYVTVDITAFSMAGTENRTEDTIKGKMSINMLLRIPSYGMSGSAGVYLTYTGTRLSAGSPLDPQGTPLRKLPLADILERNLKEMLSGH
jgi:hypothetical protein